MLIIKCPKCHSEIAIEEEQKTTFDIDCDCGEIITAQNYVGNFETPILCTCFDKANMQAPEDKPIHCPIHGIIL